MTDESAAHPKSDQLVAFGLGKLDPDKATEIAEHLDQCRECAETIVSLQDDTFMGLVRQSPAPPLFPAGSEDSPPPVEQPEHPLATLVVASGETETGSTPVELPRELREHPRYEVAELIGRGGMGDVYKAQHKLMNRPVALKVIKPELVQNESAVRRFHREVQAAARLHHGNIVAAYDAEQAGHLHFLVMEFVDGVDLDQVVRQRGALPVELACDYIRQAAAGLQHAHELGMVHRDIKPHNLMVTASGEVKILDFGLASFVSELATEELIDANDSSTQEPAAPRHTLEQLTQMGTMMGTPDYIAPEQAVNAHTADIRADIYSLGCAFYTLLAGRSPFGQGSVLDKIKAHAEQTAPPLADFRNDVPAEVEAILRKMIAKDPAERFQTPAEVVAALAACRSVTPKDSAMSGGGRRPRRLVGMAGMFLAAVAAAIIFYIQTNNGVVRIEVVDESLQVTLNGRTITMKDGDTPLTIRAGAPKLLVRRGDFSFETESFQLRRGDTIALRVELLPGEIVVQKDGQRFGAKPLPDEQRLIPSIADSGPSALGLLLRDRSRNLRQIGGALLEYQKAHGSFPPAANSPEAFDPNGRPHLSWRVHLLPFLGQQKLYEKFRLDQPWDSEHNKPLLAEMPAVYGPGPDPARTQLLAVVGQGTAYEGQAGLKLSDLHD